MPLLSRPLSLRGRILLLFFALTVLPVSVVAGLYYFYPEPYPLDGDRVDPERVEDLLARAVTSVELNRARQEVEVARIALDPRLLRAIEEESGPDEGVRQALMERLSDLGPWTAASLQRRDGQTVLRQEAAAPSSSDLCARPGAARSVPIQAPLNDRSGTAVGTLRVEFAPGAFLNPDLLEVRESGSLALEVVDRRTGEVLFGCGTLGVEREAPALAMVTMEGAEERGARDLRAGMVEGLPWTIVAAPAAGASMGILREERLVIVGVVLGLTLLSAVAFMIILTAVMRSLDEVVGAAEQIRQGDLEPWLPPPGDDEIGRLSMAFGRMVGALQTTQRKLEQKGRQAMAGELSAMVAHEVRNPLSSIKLNLQGMARWLAARDDRGESPIMVETCLREVDRLNRVVSSILELGRPREGSRQPCSLHEVIQDTVLLLDRKIESAGSRVELDLQAHEDGIMGAPDHLKSLLINLILNALRAMLDDGGGVLRISTRVQLDPEGQRHIVTRVSDTGPGIPPEKREQIFEPFHTNRQGGSGIGLPLSRRIAADHGGHLTCEKESELTPGAEFVLRLPLTPMAIDISDVPDAEQEDLFQVVR